MGRMVLVPLPLYNSETLRRHVERMLVETLQYESGKVATDLTWDYLMWDPDPDDEDEGMFVPCVKTDADHARLIAEVIV